MSAVEDSFPWLLDSPVWVAWDMSDGRKVPKSPFGGNAKSNDPGTWGTYQEAADIARKRGYSGIGVMLSDGIVGIDLDGVVDADGKISDWAQKIVNDIGSYAEISPSGTGVHILAYADPEKVGAIGRANHRVGLEIYNHGRYFTVTGDSINDEQIADRTSAVAKLLADRFPSESAEDRLRRGVRQTVEDQVKRQANQTMRKNADRDGLRYARVPMGVETCTFCMKLASRGFVYHSEAKAGGEGNHYHPNCRCKVIPGFQDTVVDGYDPAALYGVWRQFEQIDLNQSLTRAERDMAKAAVLEGPLLNTRADPAVEYFGPAEDDDPEKLSEIKSWLAENGIKVRLSDRDHERIGYSPGIKAGEPGQLIATDGMSLSAWMHEADHARYDIENGMPGFTAYLRDCKLREEMESRAYGVEISLAKGAGYNELVDRLQSLLREEIDRLEGDFGHDS